MQPLALEALWALYGSGGWNDALAMALLDHPSAEVRAWTVRLLGDDAAPLAPATHNRLIALAASEPSEVVRSQLACTSKRLPAADGLPIVAQLLHCSKCAQDTHIPLLIWWAIEDKSVSHRDEVLALLQSPAVWQLPLVQGTIVERLAQRYLAERNDEGYAACARLLALAPTPGDVRLLVAAMERQFTGQRLERMPAPLVDPIAKLWREQGAGSDRRAAGNATGQCRGVCGRVITPGRSQREARGAAGVHRSGRAVGRPRRGFAPVTTVAGGGAGADPSGDDWSAGPL